MSIKRVAVADESGKLAAAAGTAYGSTATATVAAGVVINGGAANHESSKLLGGAAAASAEADDDDDDDEDDEYDSGVDIPGEGRKKGRGGLGAITPPLGFCLFGYFVNKLITEVSFVCVGGGDVCLGLCLSRSSESRGCQVK